MAGGITRKQYDMLRHALGLNRKMESYRNYYAAEYDDPDCLGLVKKGMMKKGARMPDDLGGLQYFTVTNFGARIARGPLLGEG